MDEISPFSLQSYFSTIKNLHVEVNVQYHTRHSCHASLLHTILEDFIGHRNVISLTELFVMCVEVCNNRIFYVKLLYD